MVSVIIHSVVFLVYLAAGAGVGAGAYWLYDYGAATAICLGGLLTVGCGLIHLATAPRDVRLQRRERARLDMELQTIKDAQSATASQIDEIRTTLTDEAREREAAITGELREIAAMIAKFAERTDRKIAAAAMAASSSPASARPRPRSDQSLLNAVKSAINDNRVELHVQPVVTVPQRRVVFYEGYSRLRDESGALIMPGEFLRVAEPSGLVAEIDNMLLLKCVQIARRMIRQDKRTSIFCNVSPTSLADETFFAQFLTFLRENRELAGSLIFEFGRDAFEALSITAERNLGRLFDIGYRFSIDRCDTIDLDLRKLERMGVRYVKIAGDVLVRQVMREDARPVTGLNREFAATDVTALFARYGVDLIADRVESERTVVELLELDIGFAQGNLFGAPKPVEASQLAEVLPSNVEPLRRAG